REARFGVDQPRDGARPVRRSGRGAKSARASAKDRSERSTRPRESGRAPRARKEGSAGCRHPPRRGEVAMACDPDVCVWTGALTGVLADRKHCPALPYTPSEIGEEARRAYEAGASVVHIHARNDDGTPTFSPDVFERIREEVRARSPILL